LAPKKRETGSSPEGPDVVSEGYEVLGGGGTGQTGTLEERGRMLGN